MRHLLLAKLWLLPTILLTVATGAYLVNVKVFLIPAILYCLIRFLPFPRPFNSLASIFVASTVLVTVLIILAALIQHLYLGGSFDTIAILISVITGLTILTFGNSRRPHSSTGLKWWRRRDAASAAVAVLFAGFILVGTGLTTLSISRFGAIQSVDGASHFLIIDKISRAEGFAYRDDKEFYPKGFHIVTAFIQDSFHLNQLDVGYKQRVVIFIFHYVLFGMQAIMLLFYLGCLLVGVSGRNNFSSFLLAIGIGPPLVLFYFVPFVFQGFVPYFYAISLLTLGLIYLWSLYENKAQISRRYYLSIYLLLTLSMSMTWSLLTPLLLALLFSFYIPDNLSLRTGLTQLQRSVTSKNWLIIVLIILQLVPLYIQSQLPAVKGEWFNAEGSIRAFHFTLHMTALALVAYSVLGRGMDVAFRQFILRTFLPFYGLLALLVVTQYVTVGELRYYSIKFSYIVEILLFVVLAAWLVSALQKSRIAWWQKPVLVGLLLTLGGIFAIGINSNPMDDWRKMFRQISGYGYPVFFESDTKEMANLAISGKLNNANAITLHFEAENNNLYGNLLVPNWTSIVQQNQVFDDQAYNCFGQIFFIGVYKPLSPKQQTDLESQIKECGNLAQRSGRQFFIITDSNSAPHLRTKFKEASILSKD